MDLGSELQTGRRCAHDEDTAIFELITLLQPQR